MFCDLVGSTALSEQLDPEELREVVQSYQETCVEVISCFDGYVVQYLGDGLLIYFGYPVAHEDDAARAARTGLGIIAAIQALSLPPHLHLPQPLQVRIGIHTGLVVIGEMGGGEKRELLALGETPNLAARIQGQAEPDTVFISAATYRLIEGLFDCEDRGQSALKGVSTSLRLYQVLKAEEAQSRFQVVARKGLTPLVGREHEVGLLRERWERVKDGTGQVVLLTGEPGIGKSRLVEALKEVVEHEEVRCLELRCSPYHQNSALYPVIEHLQRVLHFDRDEASAAKLEKLETALRGRGEGTSLLQAETVALLASLLSLPHPDGVPPLALSPQKQKEKTLDALVNWLVKEAEQAPLSCAWEDLHWADPSTLELLTLFLAQVPTTRLLVVLTFRPEFSPPWGSHSYLSQLTLSRLGRTQVEAMVETVTGGKALPPEVVQQIVAKTDGVPLFVEELTKTVLESVESIESIESQSSKAHQAIPIPTTLHDSLMARLDRLGAAKEIAQVGAVLGREFNYELLHVVSPLTAEMLQQGLRQLVEAELVYQSGRPPQARYFFKHALVQDTAYQSLLKSRRQQLHQQIAQVLAEQFSEAVETQPELVAHHYTEAGLIEQALPYWQRAGEHATQRSAYVEAIAHLTKGLELLKTLPDSADRVQQELTLQLALSDAVLPAKGHAALEMEKIVTRARELCQQLGETPHLFPVLFRLMVFYHNRGELQTAHGLSEQMLRLAQSVQDQLLLSLAHAAQGATLYMRGELTSARAHLEEAMALYDPQKHLRSTVGIYFDPRVLCRSYVSWTLWDLGYPDQGLKRTQEALALAEGLAHPLSLTETLFFAASFHSLRREWQLVRERAEAAMALATEQGFPYFLAAGTVMRGGALAKQGQVEEGIAQMQQDLAAFRAIGAEGMRIGFLPMLAAAYAKVGRVEEGLNVVAEALAFVNKTGRRVAAAGLYVLKGWLLLALSGENQAEAEVCFLKAIEVAQEQHAKSWELRASTSLARLWQQQGKTTEAHKLLSDVYNWFTEGFDTADLKEAKMLLEELV